MVSTFWKCLLVASFLLLGLVACSRPASPETVTDSLGRKVVVASVPQRIVSLSPSNTEILFALGVGDRVVGVDDFSDFPEQAKSKAKVGGLHQPSLEKIVSLNPALVLGMGEYPGFVAQLEGQRLTVVALQPKDFQGILDDIELVGRITGSEKQAQKLVQQMEKVRQAVAEKVKGAPRPRVLYEVDGSDPAKPWVAGPGSFIDGLIAMVGGSNAASRATKPWAQLSLEEIVNVDPEIIVVGDAQFGGSADRVKGRRTWQGITAVKTGRIYAVSNPDLMSRPGPRVTQGLAELARMVHPELFGGK